MRIAVTGASGFIGRHLVRQAIAAGHAVVPLDRAALSEPLRLTERLAEEQPDWLVHLAWYTGPNYLHGPQNLEGLELTTQVVRAAIAAGVPRILGAGTCVEYGPASGARQETDPCQPQTLYAACKHSAHLVSRALAEQAGTQLVWARIFHLFGPGEAPNRLVPAVIRALQEDRSFGLSPGEQHRDWLHVSDVASGLLAALQLEGGAVNICSGQTRSLRSFLDGFADALGKPSLLAFGQRPYRAAEEMCIAGDSARLRSTGWTPAFSSEQAIADTLEAWGRP